MTNKQKQLDCINYNLELAQKVIDAENYSHAVAYYENVIRSLRNLDEEQETIQVITSFLELSEDSQKRVYRRLSDAVE